MSNKSTFSTSDVLNFYREIEGLQAPEQAILVSLRNDLGRMRMLDIGVGGGRTTPHFASLVREYVGIDYSAEMIDICRSKFSGSVPESSFIVCDATSMDRFGDESFDLVLFSFNGIDYISSEDRLKALREIRRVCAKNGLFCFSTHNLQAVGELYKIRTRSIIRSMYRLLLRNTMMRIFNESLATLARRDHAIVRDSTHWFRLRTYYIRPSAQFAQLSAAGFTDIRVYSHAGRELDESARNTNIDLWLYYLCRRS